MVFDRFLNFEKHVSKICQTSYMHLRRIASIRHLLSQNAAEQLIHAFITAKLDFCNSLLTGLPHGTIHRLQLVQNAAARLLTSTKRTAHITPILNKLHCYPSNTEFSSRSSFSHSRHSTALVPFILQTCCNSALSGRV